MTEQEPKPQLLPGGYHPFSPNTDSYSTTETNLQRPNTDAILTIRVIKSFQFRSMKALVLNVDLTKENVRGLKERCVKEVATSPAFKAFRSYAPNLDTMKLYTKAHGSKTTNLIINLDHPEWIFDEEKEHLTLLDLGLENETELSLFNRQAYEEFLKDPQTKWDSQG